MKLFLNMSLVLLIAGQAGASLKIGNRKERINNQHLTQKLVNYINQSNNLSFYMGTRQDHLVNLIAIRCADPDGTVNPNDKGICDYVKITSLTTSGVLTIGYETEDMTDVTSISNLLKYSKNEKGFSKLVGMSQGWIEYLTLIRCFTPVKANKKSKATCEYTELKLTPQPD